MLQPEISVSELSITVTN